MEQTNLGDYLILDLLLNKNKGKARARDTATSMNMTVDLDTDSQTDSTYENRTKKAVVVASFNALISDQMQRLKSL